MQIADQLSNTLLCFMSFCLVALILAIDLSASKVLIVDSLEKLASVTSAEPLEIHLQKNITIGADWTPVSFKGVFNGFGHTIVTLSPGGVFGTLSDAIIYNLTFVQKAGFSATGALAKTGTKIVISGCALTIAMAPGKGTSFDVVPGLFSSVDNLSIIGSVVTISLMMTPSSQDVRVGGLILTCGTLSILRCNITLEFQLAGNQKINVGGLAAIATTVNITDSSIASTFSYTGSGDLNLSTVASVITGDHSELSGTSFRVLPSIISSSKTVTFGVFASCLTNSVSIRDSSVYFDSVTFEMSHGVIGGFIGRAFGAGILSVAGTMSTISKLAVSSSEDGSTYYGGAVGLTEIVCPVSWSLFQGSVTIKAIGGAVFAGGAIGYAEKATGRFSISLIDIKVAAPELPLLYVGGFLGSGEKGYLQNIAANVSISADAASGGIGGLVGHFIVIITACYADLRLTIGAARMTPGALFYGALVGDAVTTRITASYGVLFAVDNGATVIGGLVGHGRRLEITSSFVIVTITRSSGLAGSIGGFIGVGDNCTITNCYTIVSLDVLAGIPMSLGGFIGSALTTTALTNAIVYGSLTIGGNDGIVGNFAGQAAERVSFNNCLSTMSVKTSVSDRLIQFIGDSTNSKPYTCECANRGSVSGCIDTTNFQSLEYFQDNGWDVFSIFDARTNLMDGFIFLLAVPARDSTKYRFVLNTAMDTLWITWNWVIPELGYPFFNGSYDFKCDLVAGCHGSVTSLGVITCSSGWSGNTSHPCSKFACRNDGDCHGSSCASEQCTCKAGFSSVDCSQQPCGSSGSLINGRCVCQPTAAYDIDTGTCLEGCPDGCANGLYVIDSSTGQGGCRCNDGFIMLDGKCFVDQCLSCENGNCVADAATNIAFCTCSGNGKPVNGVCLSTNLSGSTLVLAIVVPVAIVLAGVITLAILLVRKRKRANLKPIDNQSYSFPNLTGSGSTFLHQQQHI